VSRRYRDVILLAVWMCSFEVLLWIFGILKRLEPGSKRRGRQAVAGQVYDGHLRIDSLGRRGSPGGECHD
jgi:hypothetical protein